MTRTEAMQNIFSNDDGIVREFREGLMHRIATREKLEQAEFFEKLVRSVIKPGEIDITNWNKDAVLVLLKICSESDEEYRIVNDGIMIRFVRYPQGAIFGRLADAIVSGELN